MRNVLVCAFLAFLLVSCGEGGGESPTAPPLGGGDPIDPTATLTRVQNEIFTPTCANLGCHDPLGYQQALLLTAGYSYTTTVSIPSLQMPQLSRVQPADPANSYLYRKITGSGITGDRMPQGGPPLTDAQIRLVRDWIRRGAPND